MTDKKGISQNTLPGPGCSGKMELPTPKEKEALDAMRSIKERVRAIKKRLTKYNASNNDKDARKVSELEEELASLKVGWAELEKKWKEAVKERMILLGHEEGS